MEEKKLAKIFFDLTGTGWSSGEESCWGEYLKENLFRVDNILLHVYGVSYNDVVSVVVREDNLFFDSVVERGGHSTLRIFFKVFEPTQDFVVQQLKQFLDLGCAYEGNGKNLYAIDVPPSVEIEKVINILKNGESIGLWEYEEGYIYSR